ncbi:MAG: sulfatase-like hydrolase/transferase [Clostridia bacterium]|nr:sulfatase-like hydrolase/transferase [Clostridia bacterium]
MSKPQHVLVLFCDQMRYDAMGAMGNPYIQTPNLDALAADSVIFDRALTPSPVCVPARLSMLAGRYPARTGNNQNNKKFAYTGNGFYGMMTDAGFYTCNVGKMHNSRDLYGDMGFSERHTQEEMTNLEDDYTKFIMNSPYRNVFDYNGMRSEMYYVPQVSQLPAEYHPTQWIGDKSVEFLEKCDTSRPNFLFSSFIHPHPPFCPPAPWNKLYRGEGPDIFCPENYKELKPLLHASFDCEEVLGLTPLAVRRLRNFYYACTSFVDYQVGRIIKVLRERGMYDDTMIIFTADHGDCMGDYANMGKRTMLDSAAHIPFMIKMPGQQPCRRGDVASLVDLAPTVLSACGIEYADDEFDGIDLFSARHDYVFSQYNDKTTGTYMIANEREKLIYNTLEDKYYYFDKFPESENRYDAADPHIAELRERLMAYYDSDVCPPSEPGGGKKKNKRKNPFGGGYMDHGVRHDEEAARIPEGYTIDLP